MKPLSFLLCLAFLAGCSSVSQNPDLILPQIVERIPLPMYPPCPANSNTRIEFQYLVMEDGTVRHVNLLSGSTDEDWNARAIATIMQWKYQPAYYQGNPVRLWLKQTAVVRVSDLQILTLAEITSSSKREADSLYQLLKNGCPFCDVAKLFSKSATRINEGLIGEVNIQSYPEHIQAVLSKLETDEITKPIQYGEKYVIFKRVKPQSVDYLP
ncbi:MAG: peptidylprolyl isomerase [Bacteroidetes bacterium]|nr:peptidylprolyl isomerase [Bacteroidota bacterium]